MDALLGGSFGSRITKNIREDKGYTYSPGSVINTRYHDAYWVQQVADVTTNVDRTLVEGDILEIDRLQATPPAEEELAGIKNYLDGTFILQNSSRAGIAGQLRVHGPAGARSAIHGRTTTSSACTRCSLQTFSASRRAIRAWADDAGRGRRQVDGCGTARTIRAACSLSTVLPARGRGSR